MGETPELLPCPFCGEDPWYGERMDEDIATHNLVMWKSVSCPNGCAQIEIPDDYEGGTAVERWNRREDAAAPAPQPEKIMCSRCDGSGYAWAVGNCPDCNGDGWVNAPIQPAPQPDADEREALVVAMSMDIRDNIDIEWAEAKTAADALLAAGWTRKREEG